MKVDYTVVVPTYQCPEQLEQLVDDIREATPNKYLPKRVLIVDDGSPEDDTRYKVKYLSTGVLPIDLIPLDIHLGFPQAADIGLRAVDTEHALLVHSDVRLVGDLKFNSGAKVKAVTKDVFGVLAHYIQSDPKIAVFAPYSLSPKSVKLVTGVHWMINGGVRQISPLGFPVSSMHGHLFQSHREISHERWMSVHSVDHSCMIIQTEIYNEIPFNVEMGHFFFVDDWCFSLRNAGYYIYTTTDSVVYHYRSPEKPSGSSGIPTEDSYSKKRARFIEKWSESKLSELNAPRLIQTADGIIA